MLIKHCFSPRIAQREVDADLAVIDPVAEEFLHGA